LCNKNNRNGEWEVCVEYKVEVVDGVGASKAPRLMIAQGENQSSWWGLRIGYILVGWNWVSWPLKRSQPYSYTVSIWCWNCSMGNAEVGITRSGARPVSFCRRQKVTQTSYWSSGLASAVPILLLKHFRLFDLCVFMVTYTVETNTLNKAIKTIF
jgi:hypothetical protein